MTGHDGSQRVIRAAAALAASLLIGACATESRPPTAPAPAQGLTSAYVAPAMHSFWFAHFALSSLTYDWEGRERLDASWRWDGATASYARYDSGYSRVFVGGPGGTSAEIRDELVVDFRLSLERQGIPQASLPDADHARLSMRVRQRRYSTDPSFAPPANPQDIECRFAAEFGLAAGRTDTLRATGTLRGWWDNEDAPPRRLVYLGDAAMELDFPGAWSSCPAEWLTADIRIFERAVEQDRFRGSFGADAGGELYTGAIVSERGPWRYEINGQRSCGSAPRAGRLADRWARIDAR